MTVANNNAILSRPQQKQHTKRQKSITKPKILSEGLSWAAMGLEEPVKELWGSTVELEKPVSDLWRAAVGPVEIMEEEHIWGPAANEPTKRDGTNLKTLRTLLT